MCIYFYNNLRCDIECKNDLCDNHAYKYKYQDEDIHIFNIPTIDEFIFADPIKYAYLYAPFMTYRLKDFDYRIELLKFAIENKYLFTCKDKEGKKYTFEEIKDIIMNSENLDIFADIFHNSIKTLNFSRYHKFYLYKALYSLTMCHRYKQEDREGALTIREMLQYHSLLTKKYYENIYDEFIKKESLKILQITKIPDDIINYVIAKFL